MKEIVIISGKGGTGKTSLTASFAYFGGKDIIVADCDVDAADMHLLVNPDFAVSEAFFSGELAFIDQEECIQCGKCFEVCRFDAIKVEDDIYTVDPLNCEGCGYCARTCPSEAITNKIPKVGELYISKIKTGATMVHARLDIGADNSGKLVAKVKNEAKRIAQKSDRNILLIDGSPGIGCPVISSLSGAHFVVLVTEPSVAGLHDLKRIYELVHKFKLDAGCIINKSDINPEQTQKIISFLNANKINHIASLPYDESFTKAMTMGQTIVEFDDQNLKKLLHESWEKIKKLIS